jgi:outer membrane protein
MTHPAHPRSAGLTFAAVLALLTLAVRPLCAEVRFGYIDSARIFTEYKVAQEAQARFDRQVQGWREDAAERERQVGQLRAEVRDQSPILSAARRQEKEEALQKAISEYERFIQEIWGPQGRAAQENERATAEVVAQIRAAVEKVAGAKGLNVVLDSAGGMIVYADRALDVTPDVLSELSTRAQGATGH